MTTVGLTIAEQRELLRRREVTSAELLAAAEAHVEATEPRLSAYLARSHDWARSTR